MAVLELKDNILHIKLEWWEGLFWPTKDLEIPLGNIESVAIESKMPWSIICNKRPNANIPGIICMGTFYPEGLKNGQLWCFTWIHRRFMNLTLKQGDFKKIILGMSQTESEKWFNKINQVIHSDNGNSFNN
jgi:hypothetical protein